MGDAVATPPELAITARIRCTATGVIAAIYLYDQPGRRGEEIYDEAASAPSRGVWPDADAGGERDTITHESDRTRRFSA